MPDELLYSLAARYHELVGYESYRSTAQDLFGVSHVSYAIDLPNRLQAFSDKVSWLNWPKNLLLESHTAAPYYMVFLNAEQRRGLKAVMYAPAPPTPVAFLGLGAGKVTSPPALRYCSTCVQVDRSTEGFAYWRRIHQLPGVVVCPQHGCVLVESTILRATRRCRYGLTALEQVAVSGGNSPTRHADRLTDIARDSERLLWNGISYPELEHLRKSILSLFIANDWATTRGMLRSEPIRDAWRWHFPREVRAQLKCGLEDFSDPIPFLRALVRAGRRKVHPLIAIMLVRAAGGNMGSILQEAKASPRKTAARPLLNQYPCINFVCSARHSASRSKTMFQQQGLRVEVHCTDCGFRYQAGMEDSARPKVLERGWLWDKRLTELVAEGVKSQRAIAKLLGVDPKTVRRAASRLELTVPWAPIEKRRHQPGSARLLGQNRQKWAALRAKHPSAQRSELREIQPALWAWLYRNDRRWLFKQSPLPKPRTAPQERVNWVARDRQLALDLVEHAQAILDVPGRPLQITRAELARRAGSTRLLSKRFRDRLPLASAAADKLAESREAFAKRRIRWAASKCMEDGRAPTSWELARFAALRRELAMQLGHELESAVQEVTNQIALGNQREGRSVVSG